MRRPLRRRVVSASSPQSSSNRKRPQGLVQPMRRPRLAEPLTLRRVIRLRRTVAVSAAPRVARGIMRRSRCNYIYRTAIAVIYFCRLRRKCRAQRLHAHLADLESLEAQSVRSDPGDAPLCFSSAPLATSVSKRAYRPPSSASSSVSLSDSSSSAALPAGFYLGQHPPLLNQPSGQRRQRHKATPVLPYAGRM
jgi:hypothetical protein